MPCRAIMGSIRVIQEAERVMDKSLFLWSLQEGVDEAGKRA